MNYISDREIDRISGEIGGTLRNEPKVEVLIPPLPDGSMRPWEGGLNGQFFRIRRNECVLVPESIAKLIAENENATVLSENSVREYRRGNGKRLCE